MTSWLHVCLCVRGIAGLAGCAAAVLGVRQTRLSGGHGRELLPRACKGGRVSCWHLLPSARSSAALPLPLHQVPNISPLFINPRPTYPCCRRRRLRHRP